MKKTHLAPLLLLLAACTLDEHPRDQIPEEQILTTATGLYRNTVATLYSYIGGDQDGQGLQGTCRGVYDLQTFGSDEAMLPTRGTDWYDGGLWQDMYRHTWTAGHDLMKNAWLYLYKVIALCNRSLQQLDSHRHILTATQLQQYQAEVRAIRAIYYWYLIDFFGPVPLVTSPDASMQEVRQSTRQQVFQFAVDELQATLPLLAPENSTHPGDYYGRVTQPVALFVLAKLMLNAQIYSGTPQWEQTIRYCNQLEEMGYRLEPNYEDNFAVHNETSVENIWTIPLDHHLYRSQQQNLFRSYHYRHAAAYGFTGENGSCATLTTLRIFGYDTPDVDTRFALNYWAGVVTDLNGDTVPDRNGRPLTYQPWAVQMDLSGTPYAETAGARMKKYQVDKNALKDGKLMDNDIVLFRFADVLLMRAEATIRCGRDAQADYDRVRLRAGMPTRPATLPNLLDERLLELCWEGWRRQDLIRFHQYRSPYQGDGQTAPIDETDGHTTLYPIPADIRALNSNLKQNPGY